MKVNNQGASLMVVLAIFVVLLVVAMNVVMLVAAGDRTARQEYETEQAQLYLSSIYSTLNAKMLDGTWNEAFVNGQTVSIEVSGFKDGSGSAIPVTVNLTLDKSAASVSYLITYQGKQYCIHAQYLCKKTGDTVTITLKSCEEMKQL